MTQTKGAWEDGNVEVLSEAFGREPIHFDQQCLLNHDAITRPWNQLPPCFPRTAFDTECLAIHDATVRNQLLKAIRTQPALIQPHRVKVCAEALESVFGGFAPDHAFLALSPDWGIKLTEPMATRGLAHLLGRGSGSLKAHRIRAFLETLRIPDLPDDQSLEQAEVCSEVDRIDLEVRFKSDSGKERVVLIEAKFEHKLTPGQLKCYNNKRKKFRRDFRIVGLTSAAGKGRWGKQTQLWRVVLWRDLWLRFERRRPYEVDGQLAAFMAWLWQRIGGLSHGNPQSR
ncbi:MAG: hypothetical protein OXC84_11940 [Gammaproteobacteria bacterium]|nr:hypothetical protein [Gammaproteobacteria bacterium]